MEDNKLKSNIYIVYYICIIIALDLLVVATIKESQEYVFLYLSCFLIPSKFKGLYSGSVYVFVYMTQIHIAALNYTSVPVNIPS